jgi:PST family polysaccharide transporter
MLMSTNELNKKIQLSIKWSGITEIVAKSIVPIINMILVRILTPEAFGVIAIVTMITSFADIFTDAGFQKYLIQKKFDNHRV